MISMRHWILFGVAFGLASGPVGCSDSSAPPEGERFIFQESLTSDVIQLAVTDPTGLAEADNLLRSGEARWVLGTPRRGDG
jgi:hypothetical protein